jgi:hypothetical protein
MLIYILLVLVLVLVAKGPRSLSGLDSDRARIRTGPFLLVHVS